MSDWASISPLPKPLSGHTALIYGDNLLIIGGSSNRQPSSDVYAAKIDTYGNLGDWISLQPLQQPTIEMAAVTYNDYLYVLGGAVVGGFKATTFNAQFSNGVNLSPWFLSTPLPQILNYPFAVVSNKKIYIGGNGSIYAAPILLPNPTPAPDTTKPTVKITSPLPDAAIPLNSKVIINANVSDDIGVGKVQFIITDSLKGIVYNSSDTTAPYTATWQTSKAGPYTITARAFDQAGNIASNSIVITVKGYSLHN